jgi:hypothetical protein
VHVFAIVRPRPHYRLCQIQHVNCRIRHVDCRNRQSRHHFKDFRHSFDMSKEVEHIQVRQVKFDILLNSTCRTSVDGVVEGQRFMKILMTARTGLHYTGFDLSRKLNIFRFFRHAERTSKSLKWCRLWNLTGQCGRAISNPLRTCSVLTRWHPPGLKIVPNILHYLTIWPFLVWMD